MRPANPATFETEKPLRTRGFTSHNLQFNSGACGKSFAFLSEVGMFFGVAVVGVRQITQIQTKQNVQRKGVK